LADALSVGAATWNALAAVAPMASPFTTWGWYRAWLDAMDPETRGGAFVLALHDEAAVPRAVLPLALRRVPFRRTTARALTWATGMDGSPDHLDIPAHPEADIEAFIPALEALEWDVLFLTDVAENAPGVERLVGALEGRGYAVKRLRKHCCPFLDLPNNWDAYLNTLSGSRRQSIRRRERKLARDYGATFTDYTRGTLDEGWRRLLFLHKQRWDGVGGFIEPHSEVLVRRFLEELDANDALWLSTLDLRGESAAAWCGFVWKGTVYFYMCGREPRWEQQGVGAALMARMIRCAIERGVRHFDFMKGNEGYKWSWTSTARYTHEVMVFRPGLRGAWLRGLETARAVRQRIRDLRSFARPNTAAVATASNSEDN
jgi:CelD/BcsL family acetyltransferase involved in cellulose biosynthesis